MIKKVCVFASSCNFLEPFYYEEAKELGRLIAEAKMNLVYGGSCLGLMWACAQSVKQNGGKITGVMPKKLHDMDEFSKYCDEFFLTPCMRTRKAKMDELSDALITLPGGFGTLEEVSEMIVQKQLGYNKKAVVILNTNGFYNSLLKFFDEIIEKKFAGKTARGIYYIAKTPIEAVEYLKSYKEDTHDVTKEDLYSR